MAFNTNNQVTKDKKTGFTFRGKEIVLSKQGGRPFTGLVKKGMEKGIYPEAKMIEAATIYAATGSLTRTAELTKVNETTIRAWRKTEAFQELLREIWAENNEKIDAKFTEIIEKSLDAVLDRLDHGDYHVTSRGELVRKPINAKELSLVQAINVDKRQLLRGLPTSRSESTESASEKTVNRLEKLAETFQNLARYGRQPRVLDVQEAEIVKIEDQSAESAQLPADGAGDSVSSS